MILYLLELAGVAVFAISGALAAGRKSLDLLGVVVIGVVTALGGGTTRDLLLDRHPVAWIDDPTYLFVILGACMATVVWTRIQGAPRKALLIADAFGLALFTIGGTRIAQEAGASGVIAVLMGTMTGVAGGVIRDILCNEIPLILRRGNIYATAAMAGATVYLLLQSFDASPAVAGILGAATVGGLRLAAIFRGLKLPVFTLPPSDVDGDDDPFGKPPGNPPLSA